MPTDSQVDPKDVYVELAVVLGTAYCVIRHAERNPGRGINYVVAWLLYYNALQMLVLVIHLGL